MKKKNTGKKRINCLNCRHYYVTWDKNFPRGCKAMGFKTRYSPAGEVYRSSGLRCLSYSPKK